MFAEFFPDLAGLPFMDDALHAIHAVYGGLALDAMAGHADERRSAEVRAFLKIAVAVLPQFALAPGRPE